MTTGNDERPIARDPELTRLLVQELERHLATLSTEPGVTEPAERAVHALKGSAGLAGEADLSAALGRLHRRMKEGDARALAEARSLVHTAVTRMKQGQSAWVGRWPVPPDDLAARPLEPLVRSQYAAEVTDRLSQIDDALTTEGDPSDAARAVFRHVHTMKGAASAVGDEAMSWFCHGLEDGLRALDTADAARAALQTVATWRVVLRALLDDPDTALATLRSGGRPSQAPRGSVGTRGSPSVSRDSEGPPRTSFDETAATIRVAALDLDRLLERFDAMDVACEALAARADRAREGTLELRRLRESLGEALRLIGAPRPWGAPLAAIRRIEGVAAALGPLCEDLEGASARLSAVDHRVRDSVAEAKRQLSSMRQTSMAGLFARLTAAIESESRRAGRSVVVRTVGAELTIDRRLAEHLVEPCLQLVRNAVAHGIETPEARAALGKPPSGTISLVAHRFGNGLSVHIEDDGSGVDVRNVRERAVAAELIAPAIAETADDDTLLSLLFVPGFSTRSSSDLLAGRGIGLEIARSITQRLGGAIRISSRAGEGFSARIDLPVESGLVTVLWVRAGDGEFALPARVAKRARLLDPTRALPPHLSECLDPAFDPPRGRPAPIVVELELEGERGAEAVVTVGVDGVGRTEEVLVRPVGPLVAGLGPYAGAIVRGDGSVRLALDGWAVATRARALAGTASSTGA